eukprot:CAMPEP_0170509450 /NCGR_PEP_ID=MMETSP0208-20121228/65225_1 /TAXON_ID=197538 /ORGANISM="Strombidium inclinatum, Strain S3" /LENGTH=93 /DNA_ID=CAMNT_0010792813 /DNA_START=845 /DNA_END=1126 /DNA_ORIENTATION=+
MFKAERRQSRAILWGTILGQIIGPSHGDDGREEVHNGGYDEHGLVEGLGVQVLVVGGVVSFILQVHYIHEDEPIEVDDPVVSERAEIQILGEV